MRRFCWRHLLAAPFLVLLSAPAWAVVGEVTVTEGGEVIPGATLVIEFEDGSETTAQEDPDRAGVYVFEADEDKAAQSLDVHVTRDDRTDTRAGVRLTRTMVGGEPRYTGAVSLGAGPGAAKAAPGAPATDRNHQGPSITVSGGRSGVRLPSGNYFRLENLGIVAQYSVFEDDDEVSAGNADVQVAFPAWPWSPGLGFTMTKGSSVAAANQINANGGNFGLFAPVNGFVTGQNLLNVRAMRDYSEYGGQLSFFPCECEPWPGVMYNGYLGLTGGTMSIDLDLTMQIGGTTNFSEMRQIDNDYYGAFVGGVLSKPIGENTQIYGGWKLEGRYNNAEANWNVTVEGFSPRVQNFSEDAFTVGGELRAGLAYNVGSGVTLFLEAGGDVFETPSIEFTDPTLTDGGAALEFELSGAYRVNAGIRVPLGTDFADFRYDLGPRPRF